jgi:hypothetical protein
VTTTEAVVASGVDLFTPCEAAVAAANCGGEGDDAARGSCLDARRAAYGRLHSPKMRRSWLIANGCPASTLDAPPKAAAPEVAVVASPVATPTAEKAVPVAPPPAAPTPVAPPLVASPPVAPSVASPAADAPLKASPPPAPPPEPAIGAARMAAPVAPQNLDAGRPAGAFSDRDRADTRTKKLHDIISSHRPEMKSCVDRQLKLAPDLQAEGTLVIDVEKDGSVPSATLLGSTLAGTPLEACLSTAASRWRFPASAHPYRISAPVKVWGSGRSR